MCSSVFTGLFIDSRRILETLKIIGFESMSNKDLENPNTKNFQNRVAASLGFTHRCARSPSGCDQSPCDRSPSFAGEHRCVRSSLGRSSAGALDCKYPALDRPHRLQLFLNLLLAFPNSCPLSPKLPECPLFFQRPIKQRKHKKKVK